MKTQNWIFTLSRLANRNQTARITITPIAITLFGMPAISPFLDPRDDEPPEVLVTRAVCAARGLTPADAARD
ncbi:hypothetical protein GCM10010193_68730 [Kitasatospora atroaurantiaca]